ncbi:MAG: hypothetical protein KY393_06790 [Actinobacteria bacterium]|nr:hypothetical protein [Actinomycetota bacterium]
MQSCPAGGEGEGGDAGTVPTFTVNRSAGLVPSFTPAASPRGNRGPPRGLRAGTFYPDPEMGAMFYDAPSAASAHIHQVRAVYV